MASVSATARALGISPQLVRYLMRRQVRRIRGELIERRVVIHEIKRSNGSPRVIRSNVYRCGACGTPGHTRRTCR